MTTPILAPLKPLPIKDRISVVYVEKGNLDVIDGVFVVVDVTGVRTHISIGTVACLMLEPGRRVSHSAVVLAARVGCLLVWIGEAGVRLYAVRTSSSKEKVQSRLHSARWSLMAF